MGKKFDWKKALGVIAPLATTMIGGPYAPIAAAVIGKVFNHDQKEGADEVPTETEIAKYMENATPEQLIALRKIGPDLEVKLKELGVKEDELIYADKANARATHKDSQMPAILAITLTIGFFGSLAALFIWPVPEANKAIVFTMLGSLGTCWLGAMQYYFGTTKSSGDKTKIMSSK